MSVSFPILAKDPKSRRWNEGTRISLAGTIDGGRASKPHTRRFFGPSRGFQKRQSPFPMDLLLLLIPVLSIMERNSNSNSKEDRNRWASRRDGRERKVLAAPTPGSRLCGGEREATEKNCQSFSGFGDGRVVCVSLQEAEE